jgi:peptide chain release factor 2
MLGGEHDRKNAIVTIHPGAGGTESQDWAEMLLRMYLRWTERRGFKREVIDYQPADEAGLKSVTFTVAGEYAYGLLSAEAGVHRLVRISPFDQAARRTPRSRRCTSGRSFPRMSTLRSMIRICGSTPIDRAAPAASTSTSPTPPSASRTCRPASSCPVQNERSQHRNRDSAMKVLKARLYDLKMKENQAKLNQISGAKKEIAFGHQIRSYVLHPYRLAKDHRTKEQVGDVDRVLDGDIDPFIKAYLMKKSSGTLGARPLTKTSTELPSTGRSAFLVASGILVTRLTGLVRQRLFAHYFGLGCRPMRSARPSASRISCRISLARVRSPARSFPCTRHSCPGRQANS